MPPSHLPIKPSSAASTLKKPPRRDPYLDTLLDGGLPKRMYKALLGPDPEPDPEESTQGGHTVCKVLYFVISSLTCRQAPGPWFKKRVGEGQDAPKGVASGSSTKVPGNSAGANKKPTVFATPGLSNAMANVSMNEPTQRPVNISM